MENQNQNEKFDIKDINIQPASFQLLLRIASRIEIMSTDISIIKTVLLEKTENSIKDLELERQNLIDDYKKKQYEILADVMTKFPKQDNENISLSALELMKPFLENMFLQYSEFLAVVKKKFEDDKPDLIKPVSND